MPKFLRVLLRFASLGFIALALIFAACCIGFYEHSKGILSADLPAVGTVIANVPGAGVQGSNATVLYPQFAFISSDGATHTITSTSGSAPADYSVGQKVSVLYPVQHPEQAILNTFMQLWFLPTLMGVLGVGFFLIGAGMFWIVRRFAKDPKLAAAI
jgi:Protein of unknown function (DUF3592)